MSEQNNGMVQCAVCTKQRYRQNMTKIRMWGVDEHGVARARIETVPWCCKCEKATRAKSPEIFAGRRAAYAAYLMREWDGKTEQVCTGCGAKHPDVLYPYTSANKVVVRRGRCLACRAETQRVGGTPARTETSAFAVATGWIERMSGRAYAVWRQDEHEAQCVLMREMCGIPHHGTGLLPGPAIDMKALTQRQEQLWRKRMQATITQYVPTANDWRAWHCG